MISFNFQNNITDEIDDLSSSEHDKYEELHELPCNYTPFYLIAKEQDVVVGLINGFTAYAEVYVDEVVVFSDYRGQGIGTKLLEMVYEKYKDSGFDNINLCTNAFQAPGFYEKCGFTLEFVRKNRSNPKLDKSFYVRYFEEQNI